MNEIKQNILSDREAANYIGMSESWLRQSRMKGTGPIFIKIGRSVRYRLIDLDIWLEGRVRTNTLYL